MSIVPKRTVNSDGDTVYKVINTLHREDGPAFISKDGKHEQWYYNGLLHREDGPADIYYDDKRVCHGERWYFGGVLHNIQGGPCQILDNFTEYRTLGRISRLNGPAIIRKDGSQEWWINGLRHREDGPAIDNADGSFCYYIKDKKHRSNGEICEYNASEGISSYYEKGNLHRIDGPAEHNKDYSSQRWYFHGKLHNENGPAISNNIVDINRWEQIKGSNVFNSKFPPCRKLIEGWFIKGKPHRIGAPALITESKELVWSKDGKLFREDLSLPVIDGQGIRGNMSAWVDSDSQFHRDGDLPAIINSHYAPTSHKHIYYKHGVCHNDSDYAVMYASGQKEFWLKGKPCSPEDFTKHKIRCFFK